MTDQQHELVPAAETRALATQPTPMDLLARAVDSGIDAQSIETLAKLAWQQEERNAAKEYASALAEFKRRCPAIRKTKGGPAVTRGGTERMYYYAPLEEITRTIDPILQDLDLSYSWDTKDHDGLKTVTCVLRHANGHREHASFTCPCDSKSPAMSGQQKHGGADTYARRYSLTAILGITTADEDADGADMRELITDAQAAELRDLAEHPNVDVTKFLHWIGAEDFHEIAAGQYEPAKAALLRKARA